MKFYAVDNGFSNFCKCKLFTVLRVEIGRKKRKGGLRKSPKLSSLKNKRQQLTTTTTIKLHNKIQ